MYRISVLKGTGSYQNCNNQANGSLPNGVIIKITIQYSLLKHNKKACQSIRG